MSIDGRGESWLLLIYTVPRSPSRMRATIWRDLKKAGAVYLRDGVCILPRRVETERALGGVANKVRDFGGQATLVVAEQLEAESAARVIADAGEARAAEYAELQRAAEQLRLHLEHERAHRALHEAEMERLRSDLDKLRHWHAQIQARDYYPDADTLQRVAAVLAKCDMAFADMLDDVTREAAHRASGQQ
jgi:DNA-binding transcriptional regulator PaaX